MGEGYGDLAALPPSRSWERVTDIEKRLERCHPHQLRLSSFVAKATYPLPSKGEGFLGGLALADSTIRIAILLPCYNEEAAVARTVAAFRAALPDSAIYV